MIRLVICSTFPGNQLAAINRTAIDFLCLCGRNTTRKPRQPCFASAFAQYPIAMAITHKMLISNICPLQSRSRILSRIAYESILAPRPMMVLEKLWHLRHATPEPYQSTMAPHAAAEGRLRPASRGSGRRRFTPTSVIGDGAGGSMGIAVTSGDCRSSDVGWIGV